MTDETMTVSEAAELLGMSRPNVPEFLCRRKIDPVQTAPRRWRRSDIERAKAEYVASGRAESDALRRASALGERKPREVREARDPDVAKTGQTGRLILLALAGHLSSIEVPSESALRGARHRLVERGLIVRVGKNYVPTARGAEVAKLVAAEEDQA